MLKKVFGMLLVLLLPVSWGAAFAEQTDSETDIGDEPESSVIIEEETEEWTEGRITYRIVEKGTEERTMTDVNGKTITSSVIIEKIKATDADGRTWYFKATKPNPDYPSSSFYPESEFEKDTPEWRKDMAVAMGYYIPEEIREQLASFSTPYEIPDEIQSQLDELCDPNSEIFVMYNVGSFVGNFASGRSIQETLFSGEWKIFPYYIEVLTGYDFQDQYSYQMYKNYCFNPYTYKRTTPLTPMKDYQYMPFIHNIYQSAYQSLKDPSFVLRKLGAGAKIEKTYVLGGSENNWAIYYVTNQGDYVLYQENLESEAHFFSLDGFVAYTRELYNLSKSRSINCVGEDGSFRYGVGPSEALVNIEAYEFHPEKSNRWVLPTAIAAGTGTLGACAIVLLKKRKRKT